MKITLVFLLILLTGCAGRSAFVWEHTEGLDDLQLQQAQKECRQIAQREVRYPYHFYSPYGHTLFPFYRPFYYHDRYYVDDWIWHDHFAQMRYQEELSRLYRVCMEAKGWRLVRIPAQQPDKNNSTKRIDNN